MADPTTQLRGMAPQYATRLLFCGLVVGLALFNAVLSPLGDTAITDVPKWQMLLGAILAQPLILSAWAALGPGSIVHRLPRSLTVLALLCFAEGFKKWNIATITHEQYRLNVGWVVFAMVMFAIATILFLLVRRWGKLEIAYSLDDTPVQLPSSQFGMKYLLGWMTVAAVLLGIGHLSTSQSPFGGNSALQLIGELSSVAGAMLLAVFPPITLSLLVLSQRFHLRASLIVILLWGPILLASIEAIPASVPLDFVPTRIEMTWMVLLMQLGTAAAGLVSAAVLRFAGYRLVKCTHNGSQYTAPTS